MKKFFSGLLAGVLLMFSIVAFAAPNLKESYVNETVKLIVNGKPIKTEIITAKIEGQQFGKNYVSARDLAEALGATVTWEQDTQTIVVTNGEKVIPTPIPTQPPVSVKYSYTNPAPKGIVQSITVDDLLQEYTVEITLTDLIRGEKAYQMMVDSNMFTQEPSDGYEYIIAKFFVKLLDINEGQQLSLSEIDFTLVSEQGKDYDFTFGAIVPEPSLTTKMYEGATHEGWACFMVKKDDSKPKITYGRDYNGTGGLWFKAY